MKKQKQTIEPTGSNWATSDPRPTLKKPQFLRDAKDCCLFKLLWENLLRDCMRLGKNENQLLPARQIRISGQFSLLSNPQLQKFHSRQNGWWENLIHLRQIFWGWDADGRCLWFVHRDQIYFPFSMSVVEFCQTGRNVKRCLDEWSHWQQERPEASVNCNIISVLITTHQPTSGRTGPT